MAKLFIEDLNVRGKRVLMRVDFNVPLDENFEIIDDTRIRAALPSINYVISGGGRAILMSHLGCPTGKVTDELRLAPVAERLSELVGKAVTMAPDCVGYEVEKLAEKLSDGDILLLENLRFHAEEEASDDQFAKKLASLGDVYVNDAFGTAHRAHASTVGVTKYLEKCAAGYLLRREIRFLGDALTEPAYPFIAIIGGAKASSKIPVIGKLIEKVDSILIGGGMAYTFLKALGEEVGESLLEVDKVDLAAEIMTMAERKGIDFVLPSDFVVADRFDNEASRKIVSRHGIEKGWMGMDMGPESVKTFGEYIEKAKTILWNGPVGVFEMPNFASGTFSIARKVADSSALSIIGGGDSVSAVIKAGVADKVTHMSTGGGASLEYIERRTLPGIEALTESDKARCQTSL